MTTTHTLIINQYQKDLIVKALETYSLMLVGQTAIEQEAARKLVNPIKKSSSHTSTNLTGCAG